jgi:hypothetical protein
LGEQKLPLRLEFRQARERNAARFDRMNALIRDIARHELGRMTVSEREHERVVERWKRCDAWPRYSDPEPNYDTGEVMYLPKSRSDLDDDELKGICQWLDHYIDTHGVTRHDPQTLARAGEAA